jgi:hypothetical protein
VLEPFEPVVLGSGVVTGITGVGAGAGAYCSRAGVGATGVAPGGVSGVNDSYIEFLLPGPRRSVRTTGSMGAEEPIVCPVSESSVIKG